MSVADQHQFTGACAFPGETYSPARPPGANIGGVLGIAHARGCGRGDSARDLRPGCGLLVALRRRCQKILCCHWKGHPPVRPDRRENFRPVDPCPQFGSTEHREVGVGAHYKFSQKVKILVKRLNLFGVEPAMKQQLSQPQMAKTVLITGEQVSSLLTVPPRCYATVIAFGASAPPRARQPRFSALGSMRYCKPGSGQPTQISRQTGAVFANTPARHAVPELSRRRTRN